MIYEKFIMFESSTFLNDFSHFSIKIFFFLIKNLIIMVSLNDIKERNSYHINSNYDDIYMMKIIIIIII